MLKIKDISKYYDKKIVLENISINLPKGKITSFIGANGAGKSTLLAIVSRLLKQSGGTVFIDEHKISDINTKDLSKKLSILRQANHLNIRLTIKELVCFGRFPYSGGRLNNDDHEHVEKAINYMGLTDIQNSYIDILSGGQRQRAFIAMIVAQDTEYILLDEPLNNLDMKHSVQIMKILRRLADEMDKTVVIVLHDINFASCYSDYIAALKKGQLVKFGNVNEVVREDVLSDIYDMKFNIKMIENKKICVYHI